MADVLSEKARELIARPVLASLATLNPDGSPQITPLWVDHDGDDVLFNTAQGRKKARNLERDGRVAVTVIDPDDQYNVVAFRGTVTDVTTEARTHTSMPWPRSISGWTPIRCAVTTRSASASRCTRTTSLWGAEAGRDHLGAHRAAGSGWLVGLRLRRP